MGLFGSGIVKLTDADVEKAVDRIANYYRQTRLYLSLCNSSDAYDYFVREHTEDIRLMVSIVLKETDKLIGYCHIDHRAKDMAAWLSINIGDKTVRGIGIGSEVMRILLQYCFMVLGVYSVHLDVLETNKPAIKCYEKVGFKVVGRYRGHCYYNRQHLDWLHMDILCNEYLECKE